MFVFGMLSLLCVLKPRKELAPNVASLSNMTVEYRESRIKTIADLDNWARSVNQQLARR